MGWVRIEKRWVGGALWMFWVGMGCGVSCVGMGRGAMGIRGGSRVVWYPVGVWRDRVEASLAHSRPGTLFLDFRAQIYRRGVSCDLIGNG